MKDNKHSTDEQTRHVQVHACQTPRRSSECALEAHAVEREAAADAAAIASTAAGSMSSSSPSSMALSSASASVSASASHTALR